MGTVWRPGVQCASSQATNQRDAQALAWCCTLSGTSNHVFFPMAALQIFTIVEPWLWFAPCPEQKTIGSICAVTHATPH